MLNFNTVAQEAYRVVIDSYSDLLAENGGIEPEENELYLYVYPNGEWTIDHAQYLQDHRIASCASIYAYVNEQTLASELEMNYLGSWDDVYVNVDVEGDIFTSEMMWERNLRESVGVE